MTYGCTTIWNAGMLECRNAGMPERRNTETRNTKLLKHGTHENINKLKK